MADAPTIRDLPQSRRPDPIDLHVAARLRRRRLELGLDPQLLDLVIGAAPGTIERIECGDRRIGAAQLFRVGEVLGVDVPYFFDGPTERSTFEPLDGPEPDAKAVAEAKRFARAYFRVADSRVRRMIRDLVRSVADQHPSPAEEPEDVPVVRYRRLP
ncbi:MAG: helix-turn-helix domain-containing protein [Rhodospirillales bacterium]